MYNSKAWVKMEERLLMGIVFIRMIFRSRHQLRDRVLLLLWRLEHGL